MNPQLAGCHNLGQPKTNSPRVVLLLVRKPHHTTTPPPGMITCTALPGNQADFWYATLF